MKEPGAWVIGAEANADLRSSNSDDITARRVDKVGRTVHALDDIKRMAVDWVDVRICHGQLL